MRDNDIYTGNKRRMTLKKEDYIDKDKFIAEMIKFTDKVIALKKKHKVEKYQELDEMDIEKPRVTNYIGECIYKIAYGLSTRPNFYGYRFREDMVMCGVEVCLRAIYNYEPNSPTRSGKPNPFSYFTRVCWNEFGRIIQQEKKIYNANMCMMNQSEVENHIYETITEDPAEIQSIINSLQNEISYEDKNENPVGKEYYQSKFTQPKIKNK